MTDWQATKRVDLYGQESATKPDERSEKKSNYQKYAENTSVGGLSFVLSGSSKVRRILWLVILLSCIALSFYLLRNSITKLIIKPSATTITNEPNLSLEFPAVTICNLNWFSVRLANAYNPELLNGLRRLYSGTDCDDVFANLSRRDVPMGALVDKDPTNFIGFCSFGTRTMSCDRVTDFDVSISRREVCYTFNSGKNGRQILKANGTGSYQGLQMLVSINQDDYVGTIGHHAGIRVALHPPSEPPTADEQGLLVPPGTSASIGFRKHITDDRTKRGCSDTSYAECIHDHLYERLRGRCSCFSSVYSQETADQAVNVCPLYNFCCYNQQYNSRRTRLCPPACISTEYEITSLTYALFPTKYFPSTFSTINPDININLTQFRENWILLEVYFSTLSVQTQTTAFTYGVEEFFAEVGGQLGLCIGVSIISLFEFVIYILDEIKDRCCKPMCFKTKKGGISVI